MAVDLQYLFQKIPNIDVNLIAGEKGIHNLVSWVHMVETIEASDFLSGGEIAFTTGLGLSQTTLLDLVKALYERKAAAIIINTGPFIDEIPEDAIEYCNNFDFPLYVIPWRVHLAEVMRIFSLEITKDDQRLLETASAFKNAINFPKQEELYVTPLSQRGFQVDYCYSVAIIKLYSPSDISSDRLKYFSSALERFAMHTYNDEAVFIKDNFIVIIKANCTEEELKTFMNDIVSHANQILLPDEGFKCGCGKLTKSLRCLYKSYKQAESILRLNFAENISFYSDMGIYKLLMAIDDVDIIDEYCEKTVEPIIEYDQIHGTDFSMVLRCYLNHNGSIKDAADELFVHRNTITYKLNKIQEHSNLNLSSLDTRLQILVGFMLWDMEHATQI